LVGFFAIYALVIAVAFAVLFKHKHNPLDVENKSLKYLTDNVKKLSGFFYL
jgi:hypothetical protein